MPGQTKLISEIFDQVASATTREDKIYLLKINDRYGLRVVLQGIYSTGVPFIYKTREEIPQYQSSPNIAGPGYIVIDNALSDLYLFIENNPLVRASRARLDQLYIQILESLEPKDAEVWIAMTLKQPISGIDASMVQEAFPEIPLT
jgi:hypothetical protein